MVIDVLAYVQITGTIMLGLSIMALYGATQRGIGITVSTLLAVALIWAYWIASYQEQLQMIMENTL